MNKRIFFSLLLLISVLTGCSQDKAEMLKGNWIAEYADQKIQTNEELSQYNYLEVGSNRIHMKIFTYQNQGNSSIDEY